MTCEFGAIADYRGLKRWKKENRSVNSDDADFN
jgi:hypothetical protein